MSFRVEQQDLEFTLACFSRKITWITDSLGKPRTDDLLNPAWAARGRDPVPGRHCNQQAATPRKFPREARPSSTLVAREKEAGLWSKSFLPIHAI